MSLSSDKLNGHPTATDPKPHERASRIRAYNGWPQARAAAEVKEKAGTPAEQVRRIKMAAANKSRALRAIRNKKLLEIYDVPLPVRVPGEDGFFSRWMKQHESKRIRFKNLEDFCGYLLEHFGDDEKDHQWREFLANVDPVDDPEEQLAAETAEAILHVEQQTTSVPALSTSELPPDFRTTDITADAQVQEMTP